MLKERVARVVAVWDVSYWQSAPLLVGAWPEIVRESEEAYGYDEHTDQTPPS